MANYTLWIVKYEYKSRSVRSSMVFIITYSNTHLQVLHSMKYELSTIMAAGPQII